MRYKNVTLSYGERTILRDVSFTIAPGEFVFLIGASGSGKTSLIRSIIGYIWAKHGHIYDDRERDIALLSPKELIAYRRNIGIIFQDFKLLPKKTVRENVAFALEVCGYGKDIIGKRTSEVLSQVWLLSKKDKFIETLSGGEIQRVCIARALIHSPAIIIGDEPTGNLDRKNADEIIMLLEKLNEEGKTIIMSTHDEHIVNTLKKRVIAFQDGKVISDTMWGNYCL